MRELPGTRAAAAPAEAARLVRAMYRGRLEMAGHAQGTPAPNSAESAPTPLSFGLALPLLPLFVFLVFFIFSVFTRRFLSYDYLVTKEDEER